MTDVAQDAAHEAIRAEIDGQRRGAVHEGHRADAAVRLLQPRGGGAQLHGRGLQGRERAGGRGIRNGIKAFSDWPTIPQLYVKGEFVGGCDIVTEMTLSGELDELFTAKGIAFDADAAAKIREANR